MFIRQGQWTLLPDTAFCIRSRWSYIPINSSTILGTLHFKRKTTTSSKHFCSLPQPKLSDCPRKRLPEHFCSIWTFSLSRLLRLCLHRQYGIRGHHPISCSVHHSATGLHGSEYRHTRDQGAQQIFVVVLLNFLLLFVETDTEKGYAQMVATYAVKGPLRLTPAVGSYLTSTFWGTFTVSRFCAIFLSLSSATCFGIAPLFPTAIAWIEQYITVTNKFVALFATGCAFGEMVIPYTITTPSLRKNLKFSATW
ncbi:hypothetical protein JTE90_018889 [Oedothorax gibbosus]|uniref:Uncharacterized protein n=1 Tax=Oedothorax gibbosus TaxID=931172 RepID=A0AAV6UA83_9ARAC|nr:hypothetical protein JTE90_018889 [Oedothorax gibbosus]